eukprot:8504805-Pyramimonas_sp.AAC.1
MHRWRRSHVSAALAQDRGNPHGAMAPKKRGRPSWEEPTCSSDSDGDPPGDGPGDEGDDWDCRSTESSGADSDGDGVQWDGEPEPDHRDEEEAGRVLCE